MINLGLIGVGKWGINYLNTVKNVENAKIKYICSHSQETLNKFSDSYIKSTNYRDLLKYSDLDGVIIATPALTHFKMATVFIKARIPILIEKPVCISYKESQKLRNLIIEYKSLFVAGHIYIYHPAIIKMKQLFTKIGDLRYIQTQGGSFGPFRSDISALWDWAPHDVSLCLYLIGKYPYKIQSWGENYSTNIKREADNIHFRMFFTEKIISRSNIGRMFPIKRRSVLAIGSKGILLFDDTQEKKLILLDFSENQNNIVNIQYPMYEEILPLQNELEFFIKRIKNKLYSKIDIEFTMQVTKIIQKIENGINQSSIYY